MEKNDYKKLKGIHRVADYQPTLNDSYYLETKFIADWLERAAAKYVKGLVFDYGCGSQQYRPVLERYADKYLGGDIVPSGTEHIDVIIQPDKPLPLTDCCVKAVLSTQVLEHTQNFDFYLSECYRILSPGGYLLISAPMQWRHHEFNIDFWRFTKFGLKMALERNGFEIVEVEQGGGSFAIIGQVFLNWFVSVYLVRKQIYPYKRRHLWIIRTVNRLFEYLDKHFPDEDDSLTWMFVARKGC